MSPSTSRRLGAAAALLALSVLLSRLLGFFRDAVIAWRLGASAETDAYFAAFWLPDLLHYFLSGGALSITFIPLFAGHLARGTEDRGWKLFSTIATVIGAILVPATIVAWIAAPTITAVLFPGFDDAQRELTTRLTRIVLPAPFFHFLGGLLIAVESARQRFVAAAVAPLLYNLGIILGGLLLAPWLGVDGFSWGAVAGAFAGPFLVPFLRVLPTLRYRPSFDVSSPEFRRYLSLALPLMLGVSLTTVDEWLGRYWASSAGEGAITWLNNARRLMLIPVALVGQAVGQAALPFLARLRAEGRQAELASTVSSTVEVTAALGTAASMGLAVLATPLVAAIYHRGAFGPADVDATASVLVFYAFAVGPWCAQNVVARAFWSSEDMWRPTLATSAITLAAIPLYGVLARAMGLEGIALAGVLGILATTVALATLLRHAHGLRTTLPWLAGTARGLAAGALAALVSGAALKAVRSAGPPPSGIDAWVELSVGSVLFGGVAALALLFMGGPAATGVRGILRRAMRRVR